MEPATLVRDESGTAYELASAPAYEITFQAEAGKKPLQVIIELSDPDLLANYRRWHDARSTAGWNEALLQEEVYPAAAKLVVWWSSKRLPCTPENKLSRLSGDSGLRLLYIAWRLMAGKKIAGGDLMISKMTSVKPLS